MENKFDSESNLGLKFGERIVEFWIVSDRFTDLKAGERYLAFKAGTDKDAAGNEGDLIYFMQSNEEIDDYLWGCIQATVDQSAKGSSVVDVISNDEEQSTISYPFTTEEDITLTHIDGASYYVVNNNKKPIN